MEREGHEEWWCAMKEGREGVQVCERARGRTCAQNHERCKVLFSLRGRKTEREFESNAFFFHFGFFDVR